ncbi:hypothetical protein [Phocoenobacter skyensis]|uniref:Uncharacterized protein n=1 Tax=Phocoenobacter skyensis TaxID=97481 RepID=A0AAJ6NEM9_9PAST|nr:hypothetical protein [Pasteurella skyensis]MDP8175389.1 hypothetical protein [Pasteurella skyensis]
MSRVIKRKIKVLDNVYIWTLKRHSIYIKNVYIKVFKENYPNSILYIDPYSWHFEIRPKTIMNAIIYGLDNGWQPEINNCSLFIGINENGFVKLKENSFYFDERNRINEE